MYIWVFLEFGIKLGYEIEFGREVSVGFGAIRKFCQNYPVNSIPDVRSMHKGPDPSRIWVGLVMGWVKIGEVGWVEIGEAVLVSIRVGFEWVEVANRSV